LLLTRFSFSVFERIDDSLLCLEALSRSDVPTRQEIIVQSAALVDGPQGRRGQVEAHHFVEDFRIDAFDKDVGFEGSLGVLHREGKVVTGSNILSVVQTPTRSIGTKPSLVVVAAACCCLRRVMLSGAIVVDGNGSAVGQRKR